MAFYSVPGILYTQELGVRCPKCTFTWCQVSKMPQNLAPGVPFLPASFDDTWVLNAVRNIGENDIQLRNRDQIRPVHSNLASLDAFPLFNFPKIWQDFPDEQIKITRKISEFDAKLKKFFINDLEDTIICNRLFCPACLGRPR